MALIVEHRIRIVKMLLGFVVDGVVALTCIPPCYPHVPNQQTVRIRRTGISRCLRPGPRFLQGCLQCFDIANFTGNQRSLIPPQYAICQSSCARCNPKYDAPRRQKYTANTMATIRFLVILICFLLIFVLQPIPNHVIPLLLMSIFQGFSQSYTISIWRFLTNNRICFPVLYYYTIYFGISPPSRFSLQQHRPLTKPCSLYFDIHMDNFMFS